MWHHPHYPQEDPNKKAARERFRKVILLAGYTNPEPILAEWFEKYWNDERRSEFLDMLTEYEEKYKDRQDRLQGH